MGGMSGSQIIGMFAGAVIGGLLGGVPGAMLGMSIGGMVATWVDPPPAPDPPPLGDLGLNSYVHNAPIPLAYGQNKVYGGCIWIGEIDIGSSSGGSKKSPTSTPWMELEFAVGHCEGEVTEFIKYWINDKDTRDLVNDGQRFVVRTYLGDFTQTVDPSIEAFLAGNEVTAVPFRGTAYSYVWAYFGEGYFTTIPNFSAEIKCLLTEPNEEDANPIKVLYDFMTNSLYGAGINPTWFDGEPSTASSWKIAADYCDELVSYQDENGDTITEPRFRYSNVFDSRIKGYDIIKDILQSCRCILGWSQGQLYVKIETGEEEVSGYFSDEYIIVFEATGSSTTERVYFSTAIEEPAGFWEGAYLNFTIDGKYYAEMINLQGADYVDLVDALEIEPPAGTSISLTKDNIKENSFNWKKSEKNDLFTSIRIEFINRKWEEVRENGSEIVNGYVWDVVEIDSSLAHIYYTTSGGIQDSAYDMYNTYNQQQIRLAGVKRKGQAMRMAKWYLDFGEFIEYYCEFTTDAVGYLYKVGDIIGVNHSTMNWEGKLFRIVSLEEVESDEVKLYCLEYNRSIYGDTTLPVFTSSKSVSPNIYDFPDQVERLHIAQDLDENKIYINFKRPDANAWWTGVQVWVKKGAGGEFQHTTNLYSVATSVKLASDIDDSQTSIPFDSTTLYGAFPDSGSFWIEDELISYTGINSTTKNFTGCTRGANAAAHDATEYCHLKTDRSSYITFYTSDIGSVWYIKTVSVNISGFPADFTEAPEESLTIA